MKYHVYYWQAADRIVCVCQRGMVNILWQGEGGTWFDVEKPPSKLPKTLVYLGEL